MDIHTHVNTHEEWAACDLSALRTEPVTFQ